MKSIPRATSNRGFVVMLPDVVPAVGETEIRPKRDQQIHFVPPKRFSAAAALRSEELLHAPEQPPVNSLFAVLEQARLSELARLRSALRQNPAIEPKRRSSRVRAYPFPLPDQSAWPARQARGRVQDLDDRILARGSARVCHPLSERGLSDRNLDNQQLGRLAIARCLGIARSVRSETESPSSIR